MFFLRMEFPDSTLIRELNHVQSADNSTDSGTHRTAACETSWFEDPLFLEHQIDLENHRMKLSEKSN